MATRYRRSKYETMRKDFSVCIATVRNRRLPSRQVLLGRLRVPIRRCKALCSKKKKKIYGYIYIYIYQGGRANARFPVETASIKKISHENSSTVHRRVPSWNRAAVAKTSCKGNRMQLRSVALPEVSASGPA